MRRAALGSLATLLLGMGLLTAANPSADNKNTTRPIRYADLGKMIRGQRGKVILVSFWSVY